MEVEVAYDGEEAFNLAKNNNYSIILLDVMLPKIDGLEVCRMIREFSNVPIIMVTAKGEDMDKIMGLEYGADDYITKPFNILELKARIKAILRRSNVIKSRDLEIDLESRRCFIKGKEKNLTAKEFDLLELFMKNPGMIFTKVQIYENTCGEYVESDDNTIMVHISNLREKIEENPKNTQYIKTIRGVGYKIENR